MIALSYGFSFLFLQDFWQSNVNVGFAKPNFWGVIGIGGFLISMLVAMFIYAQIIDWLKNDAKNKQTILLLGIMVGILFTLPSIIFYLFFNIDIIFPIVKIVKNIISFVIAGFVFVKIAGVRLIKKREK